MAALPDGQVAMKIKNNDKVVRVNKQGVIVYNLYTGSNIRGLLVQGSYLFVLHYNGTIVQMHAEDGLILKVYNTGISSLLNYASHHTDLCDIDLDDLLVASDNDVYTYNIGSQTKKVH